ADAPNPWPLHTTNDWTQNGSTAVLTIGDQADVLYAELVWGGSTSYGGEDVTAHLDDAVTLRAGGASMAVSPDAATALTIAQTAVSGFPANYYMRSADVTAFVQAARGGTYSLSGVPATEATTINSLNAAGWTLVVAVRDTEEPVRNLSVFVGGSFVDENSQQDYTVNGLCTPSGGPVDGHVVISAIEGDANLVGDQLLIGPNENGPFVNLSGPNNPANNFFCSQLNGADGQLDTSGSFGHQNQDAQSGANVPGGRQSWDVTTVHVGSDEGQLDNGQTSAVLRTITTGDSYVPIVAAFGIDVNAPDFTASGAGFAASPATVHVGDDLELTLDVTNQGLVAAEGVSLVLPIDPALELTSFSMQGHPGDIGGNPVTASDLTTGVDAGTVAPGESRHVVIDLHVASAPADGAFPFRADWHYGFEVCHGGTTTPELYSQFADVGYDAGSMTGSGGSGGSGSQSTGSQSTGSQSTGSQSTGAHMTGEGGSGGSSSDGFTQSPGANGGCGCAIPGEEPAHTWAPTLALAALALAAGRRRARKS
ncbi:MAG TPA: MYXO-CTERM sorting domain-containing protein, partial [Minicystis sp.]|nr:MYXO-CTERM sorting domain-containing protein [Minicystis sp.]